MKPLVNKKYMLEKFAGKGGWTFVRIPDIRKDQKIKKVRGTFDDHEIRGVHLMWGEGKVFLPVKAEIRKKINKEAGDRVHIILYPDHEQLKTPKELLLCLRAEPAALKFFNTLSESERKFYIQWVYSAKKEETKVDRMAKTINRLLKGSRFYDIE